LRIRLLRENQSALAWSVRFYLLKRNNIMILLLILVSGLAMGFLLGAVLKSIASTIFPEMDLDDSPYTDDGHHDQQIDPRFDHIANLPLNRRHYV
jgi:hypothetical protein